MRGRGPAQRVALLGVMTGLALMLSLLERLLPPLMAGVPGIKLGLANVVVLILLYDRGGKDALLVNVLRVLMSALLFSSAQTLLYSAAGAALSFAGMWGLKRTGKFSVVGVSVAGGVLHNVGQLSVAVLVVQTAALFSYLPVLMVAGVVTGLLMGLVAQGVLRYLTPRTGRKADIPDGGEDQSDA